MKYIQKGQEPISLTEWKQEGDRKSSNWKSFDRDVKNDVCHALLKEQGYICCYCGSSIARKECHIEHFKPKSVYKNLTFEYTNLFASCQGEDEKCPRVPVHCGHKKNNWYDDDLMVSPLDPNCANYFKYSGYGEILPTENPQKQAAAKSAIAKLALDINKLTKMRRTAIDAALQATVGLTDAEIQLLAQGYQQLDREGRYTPFCAAISYILKQYF
jgi:uncharacterized protein (TIGR02646 family)